MTVIQTITGSKLLCIFRFLFSLMYQQKKMLVGFLTKTGDRCLWWLKGWKKKQHARTKDSSHAKDLNAFLGHEPKRDAPCVAQATG